MLILIFFSVGKNAFRMMMIFFLGITRSSFEIVGEEENKKN